MKTLYLLRHAKSSWEDAGLSDHDRVLATRGRRDAQRLADYVQRAGIRPALVLCSSATRARETFHAIAPVLGGAVEVRVEDQLYGATGVALLARLRRLPDTVDSVLLIGHNPGLQDLAVELADDRNPADVRRLQGNLPTGALATLTAPDSWAGLSPGQASLDSLVAPRDLKPRGLN